ncbi:MAG: hypothetical protein ACREQ5_22825 [Candidatus Dormibacteria bacterium]
MAEQAAQAKAAGRPVLIYQVQTKYLNNVSPAGAYTQVHFVNTGNRSFNTIAFEVIPYAHGEPIIQTVSNPVVFNAKGDFEPGKDYTVMSTNPVWPADWRHPVNCVHLVGIVFEYEDGQIERVGHAQITNYLSPELAPQNCTNPSTPGPHN